MRTRIKICGVRDVATARAAADAGADAIGLVFVRRSPRFILPDDATRIVRSLPAFVEPIGLFVNESPAVVKETALRLGLRTVQLHGHEGPGVVEQLQPLRVIKAMAFEDGHVRDMLDPWRSAAANLAALLWDAPPPDDADVTGVTGGHGRRFDWAGLATLQQGGALAGLPPSILAGGLTPANVADAVRLLRPFGVDVSSGVESAPGVKSHEKIAAFCVAVRAADHGSPQAHE